MHREECEYPHPLFYKVGCLEPEGSGESEEQGGVPSHQKLTPGGCSPFLLGLFSCVRGRPVTDLMNMLPLVWSISFS